MPTKTTPSGIAREVNRLVQERIAHQQAIELIDQTLEEVRKTLGALEVGGRRPTNGNGHNRRGRATQGSGVRRTRRRFGLSGEESVLAFIDNSGNPTTRDINAHWKKEGRGGSADNTLSRLVKERKLKRKALEGERGSTYVLA